MTVDDLIAAGYKPFTDFTKVQSLGDWYRNSYQKRFTDAAGTRYFITICHAIIVIPNRVPPSDPSDSFSASNQFTKGDMAFNVDMLYHDETLDQVETFFHDLWTNMKLDYYEVNDERLQQD